MYRFDDFLIEPATFRLLKGGAQLHIEPKALELLIYLVERRDRVVSKQELLDAIWTGTAVTENALTRAIAQIRKVLGDDLQAPRYIETVPTKGYRFVAELVSTGETPVDLRAGRPPARAGRWIVPMVGLALFALVAGSLAVIAIVSAVHGARAAKAFVKVKDYPDGEQVVARPFRPDPRLQVFPAFAPHGDALAYSVEVNGTPQIATARFDNREERQLTTASEGATQPSWSPDGKWIAYASVRKGGIWMIPAEGGAPQRLTTFGSRPSWSPDGSEIAFQSAELIDYGWTAFDALPPSTIWVVNLSTRKTSEVTRRGAPAGGHGAPSWRSDGARLAFTSCDLERCAVYTIARDSSGLQEIWWDPRRFTSPVFSRDGRTLYYVLVLYDASILFALPVNANGGRSGTPVRLRSTPRGVIQHLAISRDGLRFAWSVIDETGDLVAVDANGGDARPLIRNANVRATFPVFSPDGTKIAYSAAAAGDDSGVWIANAEGSQPRALAVGAGLKQYPQWSKRGYEVLYAQWRHNIGPTLFEASLLTGRTSPVAVLPEAGSAPRLSPDRSMVAFNRSLGGVTTVWVSAPDRSALRRLTAPEELARFPIWSPSGRLLAVQARARGGIGILAPAGGDMKVLPFDGECWPYSWSPDEKEIAFAGRREGVWNVWRMDLASGKARRVTTNESTITWVQTPAWSPDGTRILYESGAPRGNIWLSEETVTN
jgi:Tol biopolymer transport system component/DNA-binding winged helix-turn-helix (wHTH) protein